MTVAQRIDALLAAGIIVEGDTTGSTGGRRRRSLVFNDAQSHVLAAAVETSHTRVALTDLRGTILADERVDVARRPRSVGRPSTSIADVMARCMRKGGLTADEVCGVGSASPVRSTRSRGA